MDKNHPNSSFFKTYTRDELNKFRNKINNVLKDNKDNKEKKIYSTANFNSEKTEFLNNKSTNNKDTKSTESIEAPRKLGVYSDKDRFNFCSKSPVNSRKNDLNSDPACSINNKTNEFSNFALLNCKENERIDLILKEKIMNLGEKTSLEKYKSRNGQIKLKVDIRNEITNHLYENKTCKNIRKIPDQSELGGDFYNKNDRNFKHNKEHIIYTRNGNLDHKNIDIHSSKTNNLYNENSNGKIYKNDNGFVTNIKNKESVGTAKLAKIEDNKHSINLNINIFDEINTNLTSTSNFKRKILKPLERTPSAFDNKQTLLGKECGAENICLSKSYNLAEENAKMKNNENQSVKINSGLLLNATENLSRNKNLKLKKIEELKLNLDYSKNYETGEELLKSNYNRSNAGKDLYLDFKVEKDNKNNDAFYLPDVSNICFQSSINKSFVNEKKNFMFTPKNSLKLEIENSFNNTSKSPNSRENKDLNTNLVKNGRRLSNLLQCHLDQSRLNSLVPKETNSYKFSTENANENFNYSNLNKINKNLFSDENSSNKDNAIRFNGNKSHLKRLDFNQCYNQRSFDFEKNKYRKCSVKADTFIKAANSNEFANEADKKNLENYEQQKNFKRKTQSKFFENSNLTNGKQTTKVNKGYKINVIGATIRQKPNDQLNIGASQFQDLSTTVFDKSEQEFKTRCFGEYQTRESKALNEIEINLPNENEAVLNNEEEKYFENSNSNVNLNNSQASKKNGNKISSFKSNSGNSNNNNNNNNNYNSINQLNKNMNSEALTNSIHKSISVVTQNKNLLENSFESNSNNTLVNMNNASQINNLASNVLNKKPNDKDLNSIEETHFNFVFISQASKKIMKMEDLNQNDQENAFNTVVEVNEIDID